MSDPAITPAVCYRDPRAAVAWLGTAFGFTPTVVIESPDGDPARSHYEVSPGGAAALAVSGIWAEWTRSPHDSVGNTQWLTVRLPEEVGAAGLDAHCERARSAGAEITDEPADEFFGDRRYRAVDPEGHHWTFAVHVRDVGQAEAEEFLGHRIERWS
ncbi:VOC family protein [Gordonia iterans]